MSGKNNHDTHGHYRGFMADAKALMKNLEKLGFVIAPKNPWIAITPETMPQAREKAYQMLAICKKEWEDGNYAGQHKKGIYQDWVIRQWPQNYVAWMEIPEFMIEPLKES